MSCDTLPLCVGCGDGGCGWGVCARVCVCVVRPVPIETGPSLDQNLAWHMLPATAGMKYVGTTFSRENQYWRSMHDLQGLARQDTD